MNLNRAAAALIALAFSASAYAAPTGNAAAGNTLFHADKNAKGEPKQACTSCHGADANTPLDDSFPHLAGQYPDYLSKALHEYKSGKRKNPVMGTQAAELTDQDIADLTAYLGSLDGTIHDLSGHNR